MRKYSISRLLANYIKVRTLLHLSDNLQSDKDQLPSACLEASFKKMTPAMNSIYVRQTFPANSTARADVVNLFLAIKKSFHERIMNLPWMDDLTRLHAMTKVKGVSNFSHFPHSADLLIGRRIPSL